MLTNLKNQKGFTLIEVILVLTLLGILGYVAISKDSGHEEMTVEAAARKVMADIRYAQSMALTTNVSHGFQVLSSTTYKIYNVSTGSTITSPYTQTTMLEDLSTNFKTSAFQVTTYQVIFDTKGKPTTGGGSTIQINFATKSKSLTVASNSGFIYLN